MTRSRPTRSRGYVLLMTVLLLAVAAVALSMLGRRSFRQAMTALQAEEDLQRRWAIRSCEEVLLPQAGKLVDYRPNEAAADLAADPPAPVAWRVLRLGELRIDLVFADEQAKLNVPALLNRTDRPTAEGVIGTLLHGRGLTPSIRLDPTPEATPPPEVTRETPEASQTDPQDGRAYRWPVIASFDQVLVDADPDVLVGASNNQLPGNTTFGGGSRGGLPRAGLLPGVVEGVTLWGDGKVNIRTAPEDVLRAALAPDLGFAQVFRIAELRREQPDAGLSEILSQLELSDQQRRRMEQRLTDGSDTHSLWIVVNNGDRRWYHLAVQTPAPGSSPGNAPGGGTSGGSSSGGGLKQVERLVW